MGLNFYHPFYHNFIIINYQGMKVRGREEGEGRLYVLLFIVVYLVSFYIDRLKDSPMVTPHVLQGILALVRVCVCVCVYHTWVSVIFIIYK